MPSNWFWILVALCGSFSLALLVVAVFKVRTTTAVFSTYTGGIELAGVASGRGRITYRIVQWLSDSADPRPCPLAIHLPDGDLIGDALLDWNATALAHKLGALPELEVWPFPQGEKVVGVSIRLIPEGLPGVRPVAVSVAAKRISLPLTDEEAVQLLGEPCQRRILR